jgi:hypothetical protein
MDVIVNVGLCAVFIQVRNDVQSDANNGQDKHTSLPDLRASPFYDSRFFARALYGSKADVKNGGQNSHQGHKGTRHDTIKRNVVGTRWPGTVRFHRRASLPRVRGTSVATGRVVASRVLCIAGCPRIVASFVPQGNGRVTSEGQFVNVLLLPLLLLMLLVLLLLVVLLPLLLLTMLMVSLLLVVLLLLLLLVVPLLLLLLGLLLLLLLLVVLSLILSLVWRSGLLLSGLLGVNGRLGAHV